MPYKPPTHEEHSAFARAAMERFAQQTGTSIEHDGAETVMVDLLGDLMHAAHDEGLDFDDLVRQADNHFAAERPGSGGLCDGCNTHFGSLTELENHTCTT